MKKLWKKIVSIVLALTMVFLGMPEFASPVKTAKADPETGEHTWSDVAHWDWADDLSSATATFFCIDDGCEETFSVTATGADITADATEPNCIVPDWTEYTATVTGPDGNTYTGIRHKGSPEDVEVYVLVDGITVDAQNNKEYLIVDSNVSGWAHALKNNNGTVSASNVLIHAADEEIDTLFVVANDEVDSGSVWAAAPNPRSTSNPTLRNGSYYAVVGYSTNYVLTLSTSPSGAGNSGTQEYPRYWAYEGNGKLAAHSTGASTSIYYLVYDNGFVATNSFNEQSGVYVYEKLTALHSAFGGHEYEFRGITWNEGFASAYATYECAHCGTTATVAIGSDGITTEHKDATCLLPDRTAYVATISAEDSLDGQEHSDGDSVYVPTLIEKDKVVENATIYVKTTTVTAGKKYMIVSTDATGSHAVSSYSGANNNDTVRDYSATVDNGEVTTADGEVLYNSVDYIVKKDGDTNIDYAVWTAGNGYTFRNGNNMYLGRNIGGNLRLRNSSSNWNVGSNSVSYTNYGTRYYLRYNNGWGLNNAIADVEFYEELTGVTITTKEYVDAEPAGHEYELVEAKDATCEATGNIEHYHCSVCGKDFADNTDPLSETYLDDVTVPMTGHDWEYADSFTWTQTETGYEAVANYKCKFNETHTTTVAATVTSESTDATCEQAGGITYTAVVAANASLDNEEKRDTKSLTIVATGHTLEQTAQVAATCEKAGNSEYYTCSVCGKYFSDADGENVIEEDSWIIPATGHKLEQTAQVAATCEKAGNSEYYTCSVCGKYFSDADGENVIEEDSWIIPAKGHDWEYAGSFTWTQTETGYTAVANYVCKNDATHTDTVNATVTSETTPATCEKAGGTTYTAVVAANASLDNEEKRDTKSLTIGATGHTLDKTDAVAATCEAAGNNEYYTCSVCGKYFSDADGENVIEENSWIIPAKGHDWEFVDFTWFPSEDGYVVVANYKCKNDETHTDTVEANVEASIDADKLVYIATVAANASLDGSSHDETKELELSGIKLSSANVEFKGLIRMRMAFTLPEDLEGSEDVFVVYYLEGEHGLEEVTRIALKDGTKITGKNGVVSYGYYCPVRTKQFADNLHIRILDANGEPMAYTAGSSWAGIDYTYSTKQYAEAVLGPNSTSSQTMKDLAQAFIDYGTTAKIYFDYDAEGCEVPDRVTAVTAEEMGESASYDKEAMEEMGFSNSVNLDFKADNSLYVYFFLPSGKTASDYTFSIKRGGSETVTTAKLVDAALNKYVVTVNNIAAKNLGEFYDFVVTDNETSKTASVHASAISYAKLIVESYNNTTDQSKINMMNLAKALYLYSEAAAAYFAGN